jgi:hypothetical protein
LTGIDIRLGAGTPLAVTSLHRQEEEGHGTGVSEQCKDYLDRSAKLSIGQMR